MSSISCVDRDLMPWNFQIIDYCKNIILLFMIFIVFHLNYICLFIYLFHLNFRSFRFDHVKFVFPYKYNFAEAFSEEVSEFLSLICFEY